MKEQRIWSVASGKGGVGKTFVVSSLGLSFARQGRKTLVVDLDLNGPNLHTALGEPLTNSRETSALMPWKKVATTKVPGLALMQGFSSTPQNARELISLILAECRKLPFHEVLFDLGPGADPFYLDLLLASDERIFVVTPEPAAIEKNYRLLENLVLHCLRKNSPVEKTLDLYQRLAQFRANHRPVQSTLKDFIQTEVGISWDHGPLGEGSPLRLIVNQVRSEKDLEIGQSIHTIARHYYDFSFDEGTPLAFDNAVWQSFRSMEAVLSKYPFSPLAGQFHTLARKYLQADLHSQFARLVV